MGPKLKSLFLVLSGDYCHDAMLCYATLRYATPRYTYYAYYANRATLRYAYQAYYSYYATKLSSAFIRFFIPSLGVWFQVLQLVASLMHSLFWVFEIHVATFEVSPIQAAMCGATKDFWRSKSLWLVQGFLSQCYAQTFGYEKTELLPLSTSIKIL